MVATYSQAPISSNGSVGQSTHKPKQRSSYRRPSEKHTSAGPGSYRAGLTDRNSQKIRSRSVCSGAQPAQDNRRPSAPVESSTQSLSIAERFMSPKYPAYSTPTLDPLPINITSPTMTVKSLELQNSNSTDFPTAVSSTGRLSVAERFMNAESVSSPSDSSLSTYTQQYRERSMSSFSGKTLQTAVLSSFNPEPVSGRLMIAETFMKPNLNVDTSPLKSETAHPLDVHLARPLDPIDTHLHPPSDQSLALDTGKAKRPWGSQDTLVFQQAMEKKKQGCGQHTVYSDTRSVASRDCLANAVSDYRTRYSVISSDNVSMHINPGSGEDVEVGYEKANDEDEGIQKPPAPIQPKKITVQPEKSPEIESMSGFWLGCCFISCRQRPGIDKQGRGSYKVFHPRKRGCGKRGWVICVFIFFVILSLVFYFVWPITPLMRIEGASLTSPAKISQTTQGIMVGNVAFESDWLVNITVDNRKNHVPTRIVQIQVVAKDALTGLVIGKGMHNDDPSAETMTISPNGISTIQLPIHVDYQARDSTDTTFLDLIKACSPKHALNTNDALIIPGQHEALPLHFWITLHFFGLDWIGYKSTVIATPATGGFVCPQ